MKKYLALIEALENPVGRTSVTCNIKFVTGELAHQNKKCNLTTDIFKYYFWGFAFETVVINNDGMINEVRDLNKEDKLDFDVEMISAVAYNSVTHEVLASNGYVYNLDESPFAGYCRSMLNRIYQEIAYAETFCLIMYTLKGAVFSLLFDKNFSKSSASNKYALSPGYVSANSKVMRHLLSKTQEGFDKKEKLSQEDIDKLIAGMARN